MGYIKTTYSCEMRFFKDSDRTSKVVWYFVDSTHDLFPGYFKFHTGNYADARIEAWDGIGEVKGTKRYKRQSNVWNYAGKKTCFTGTLDQFTNGLSIHDPAPVIPKCCAPKPRVASEGGPLIFGKTDSRFILRGDSGGGVMLGGTTRAKPTYKAPSSGGAMLGGPGNATFALTAGSDGGLLVGGSSSATPAFRAASEGGLLVGGSSSATPAFRAASEGGLLVGGETASEFDPAASSPSFIGVTWGSSMGSPLSVAIPSGAGAGDTVSINVVINNNTGSISTPSGWSAVASGTDPLANFTRLSLSRVLDGSEGSSVSVSYSGAIQAQYVAGGWSNGGTVSAGAMGFGVSNPATAPGITAVASSGLLVVGFLLLPGTWDNDSPTGYTLADASMPGSAEMAYYADGVAGGGTGDEDFDFANDPAPWSAWLVQVEPS